VLRTRFQAVIVMMYSIIRAVLAVSMSLRLSALIMIKNREGRDCVIVTE
jgi:hypothetical protein